VQQAIETMANVDSVDVQRVVAVTGDVSYLITFLSNLGDVPILTTAGAATISEVYTNYFNTNIIYQ
jgi:hypothetical protein